MEYQEWAPKWGEEVEVSDYVIVDEWFKKTFIAINPNNKEYPYIAAGESGGVSTYRHIRQPLKTITKAEAEKLLNVKIEG